ncbi:hypothetical protein QBC44DRAFT_385650 [Cladorrhinum sp. PSN332]|nr:hypothetical protein QBC44DRAFT_385650 [Cladorrhinum sp. PSN332]
MTSISLDHLLGEDILRCIVDYLEDGDVINLGMSCKALREQVAYRAFHTVRFSNDARISDSALAAAQKYGCHIKVLRYVGFAGQEDDDIDPSERNRYRAQTDNDSDTDQTRSDLWDSDDEGARPGSPVPKESSTAEQEDGPRPTNRDVLPPSALILFEANATLLPNLETISINFDHYYGESHEYGPHGASIFVGHESWADVRQREAKLTMCRLWANTYKALAANKGTPNLVIENWSPRGVSAFQTKEWKAYLRRVKSFDITIICETLARDFTNSMQGYVEDVAGMQDFFFQWLDSVQTLKVSMLWGITPFGMHGRCHIPLPMRENGCMPVLEHLELKHVFISDDLVNFIIGHKEHLHTVVLHNAQSALTEYGECATRGMSWLGFFDRLSTALSEEDGIALTKFTFTSLAPLSETEVKTGKARYKSERAAVKKVRDELKSDPNRRLFGYGDLGEEFGDFIHDVKTNQESAIAGDDQAGHDRFVKVLEENRERVACDKLAVQAEKRHEDITELSRGLNAMEGLGLPIDNNATALQTVEGVEENHGNAEAQVGGKKTKSSGSKRKVNAAGLAEQTGLRRSARLAKQG